ncbi:hypothetical protein Sar04_22090 [Salinispora arenicola]|uniref:Uncharacterized protein n=1 Tax=Salinispora arenicola TaxID=168697 RepID=A0ABQ4JR96_SALAC|nr:hypothetical protein Sar04_22090 [Salinispora arenicola]
MHGVQPMPGLAVRGGGDQFELWVPGDQAQQLTPGVAARPHDRNSDPHTYLRMTMHEGYQRLHVYAMHCMAMEGVSRVTDSRTR